MMASMNQKMQEYICRMFWFQMKYEPMETAFRQSNVRILQLASCQWHVTEYVQRRQHWQCSIQKKKTFDEDTTYLYSNHCHVRMPMIKYATACGAVSPPAAHICLRDNISTGIHNKGMHHHFTFVQFSAQSDAKNRGS